MPISNNNNRSNDSSGNSTPIRDPLIREIEKRIAKGHKRENALMQRTQNSFLSSFLNLKDSCFRSIDVICDAIIFCIYANVLRMIS